MVNSGCVFCAIDRGEVESSKVYEDDQVLAFLDINPINAGHTLVIPRLHAPNLAELPPVLAGRMMQVAQKVAAGLYRSNLHCDGVNLWLADGASAGQDVFHAHLHVLPRFKGDGFGFTLPANYLNPPPRDHLDKIAEEITSCLAR